MIFTTKIHEIAFHSFNVTSTPQVMQDANRANSSNEPITSQDTIANEGNPSMPNSVTIQQQHSLPSIVVAADPIAASYMNNGNFEKAIQAYTDSLAAFKDNDERTAPSPQPIDSSTTTIAATIAKKKLLLVGRSQAYCGLSRYLRSIPAEESEANAVYAPDPEHLASCALGDAEKALSLDAMCATIVHLARSDALFLLERYRESHDAVKTAMVHSPRCPVAATMLRRCETAIQAACSSEAGAGSSAGQFEARKACSERLRSAISSEIECTLCMRMLYEPVTTSCGHTFCKSCFARSADHSNRCPMCRTILHVGRELPVTVLLKELLEKTFPEEYAERRKEEQALLASTHDDAVDCQGRTRLPLFVMSALLPGEHMALNIFEPRYRLMIRRCMEGNRRFGMASLTTGHALRSVACEAEIVECEALPDGRYYLEIVGRRRFRVVDPGEQDGYRTATAEYVSDDPVCMDFYGGAQEREEGDESSQRAMASSSGENNDADRAPGTEQLHGMEELERVSDEVERMVDGWVSSMRALGRSRRAAADLLQRVGEKPCREDKEKLSFWMANLVCPLIECSSLKAEMMCTTSTLRRMKLLRGLMQQMQGSEAAGCAVM